MQCSGHKRSFIEIEQEARGAAGYASRVVGLTIAGRKIDPSKVEGLTALLARGNHLKPVGGYCDLRGESFGIEEFSNGWDGEWRHFRVAY
jgi:hypothetical protein